MFYKLFSVRFVRKRDLVPFSRDRKNTQDLVIITPVGVQTPQRRDVVNCFGPFGTKIFLHNLIYFALFFTKLPLTNASKIIVAICTKRKNTHNIHGQNWLHNNTIRSYQVLVQIIGKTLTPLSHFASGIELKWIYMLFEQHNYTAMVTNRCENGMGTIWTI